MGGFQPHSMDWTWTIFWLATQPICYSMLTMEFIWNMYGMVPPYAIHGLVHVDSMEFPMNLSYKSMYYSIWIPWKQILWINSLNGLSKIVSALEIEHMTLSMCHVYKYENVLTAGLSDCYKILNFPQLVVLWTGHAQSECQQMPMLNLGAINNPQHSSSTTTIIHEPPPQTLMTLCCLMVTTPNIVTMHSKLSAPLTLRS